jgi:arabinosyltransferase C
LCIVAGAIPAAVWFFYVLSRDPVFQARAQTLTYAPNFRQIFFGIVPLLVLALFGAWRSESKWRLPAFAAVLALLGGLMVASAHHNPADYFMTGPVWAIAFAFALATVGLLSKRDDAWNIAWSWAVVGLVAVYVPQLFQRKLAMGIVLPWSILAAYGLSALLKPLERSTRNLIATLSLCLMGGSALAWFLRETVFIRTNVGSTAYHAVYMSQDAANIFDRLNAEPGRKVVVAMPGVPDQIALNDFRTPIITDLNPVLSGLTGAYSFAGHWSETPDYNRRRGLAMAVFLALTSPEKRAAILDEIRPDFLIAPNPRSFPEITLGDQRIPLADLRQYGDTVYDGNQLLLIRVRH